MTFTEYTHKHYVENTQTGVYDFDCVGAVNWFLSQAASDAQQAMYQSIGVRPKRVPTPSQMYNYLSSAASNGSFTQVTSPGAITPGDVLILSGGDSGDGNAYPGHAMIAAANPVRLKSGSYSLKVYDSTGQPHGKQDSRHWDPRTNPSIPNPSVLHSGLGFGKIAVHPAQSGGGMTMSWSVGAKPEAHPFLASTPST
jgi:hypothetical protein